MAYQSDKSKTYFRHGTRCAGQVGASANNGRCVPGIAFNAKIGGKSFAGDDL